MKTDAWTARESLNFGWLLLASVAVLFAGATVDELHGTPTFYASLAREIVEAGDPLAIFRGDAAYLLKPPLVIWLAAASSALLGLSEFAVTLPSRLAAVLAIAFAYLLCRRLLGSTAAWIAALILLTNSTFIQFSTTLRMDSMLLAGSCARSPVPCISIGAGARPSCSAGSPSACWQKGPWACCRWSSYHPTYGCVSLAGVRSDGGGRYCYCRRWRGMPSSR